MAKRVLIIDGHPDADRGRLCHALADAYAKSARDAGNEVRLLTVAEAEFSVLRAARDFATPPDAPAIESARNDIAWADHLVLVFPLWLGGAPALLRAFLEQVARAGFVAETDGRGIRQKLKGKSARLIVTMGMPALIYKLVFQAHGVKNIMQGVLGFGGIAPIRLTLFGGVETSTPAAHAARFKRVAALAREGG
jgi:putative NADPH-quinone reductase